MMPFRIILKIFCLPLNTGKGDGERGRWGDKGMGRWGDGERGRKKNYSFCLLVPPAPIRFG
jgi:hypothetical protein